MDINEVVNVLNDLLDNKISNKYFELLSEFLEGTENGEKLIQFVMNNPLLIAKTINTVVPFAQYKYKIDKLSKNGETLLFFSTKNYSGQSKNN